MNVHYPVLRTWLRHPFQTLVVDDQRSWRGIELLVASFHLAEQLEPVCRSKTLGVLLPTSGLFPLAAMAGWMLGKTIVPLNYLLKQEELQYVIDDCETDTIVTCQPILDYLDTPPHNARLLRLEDVKFKGVPELRWPAWMGGDELAALLYTSGTSGKPKGVMLSHDNFRANVRQVRQWVHFTRKDTFLGVLPQFHSFGLTVLTLVPLIIGAKVVYSARFVPKRIVELMREHRPRVFIAIPSMYNALLSSKSAEAADFESLKFAVSGGEPLPDDVFERFQERFGVRIAEGYGLTETSPVTHWCKPEHFRRKSVGRPLPELKHRIVDLEIGRELAPGEEGEIQLAGPNIMRGYFKLEQETRQVFTHDGYFRTGDIGRLDDEGYLYITGRLKEMLIIGGENVFPREIEEVLNQHPLVNASAVVGVSDPSRGEVPLAFVELIDGNRVDEQELRAWCRDRLANYKVPREVRIIKELPRNPTGKIMRRELKEKHVSPEGATVAAGAEREAAEESGKDAT
jgi:long-chain acyl-CoA synthetase